MPGQVATGRARRTHGKAGSASAQRAAAVVISSAGDQALLVRLGTTISARTHARVLAALAALDQARPDWVVDCVPAYASILVIFDPLAVEPAAVEAWIRGRIASARGQRTVRRKVTVPVWYDPAVGLDLEDTARYLGMSIERVVELHTARSYLAYMLGFKPGFPYLGILDQELAAPRLNSPRLAVPAGSIGIAGRQTGIYPVTSPGGWRILGRTPLRVFDPAREAPFLILPGDEVRFEAISRERFKQLVGRKAGEPPGDLPRDSGSRHSRASGNPVSAKTPGSPLEPGPDCDRGRGRHRGSNLATDSGVTGEAS
ncbi:MAG: 5-oxoprolinase subunit PxpB [Thermoanaerobaculales bacterium]